MSTAKDYNTHRMSEQDYLDSELYADSKREYINGHVYAMAGAHRNHNHISGNLFREISTFLKGKPCAVFQSDLRVKAEHNYFYPDLVVDCTGTDDYFTDSPVLIVEVLSASTRRTDETTKRNAYRHIATVQEYLLIEQDVVDIEIIRRSNGWVSERFYMGDSIVLQSIGLTVSVVDIYDRVVNADVNRWLTEQAALNNTPPPQD